MIVGWVWMVVPSVCGPCQTGELFTLAWRMLGLASAATLTGIKPWRVNEFVAIWGFGHCTMLTNQAKKNFAYLILCQHFRLSYCQMRCLYLIRSFSSTLWIKILWMKTLVLCENTCFMWKLFFYVRMSHPLIWVQNSFTEKAFLIKTKYLFSVHVCYVRVVVSDLKNKIKNPICCYNCYHFGATFMYKKRFYLK